METLVNMQYVYNAMIFSGIGLAVFAIGIVLFDVLTPKVSVWHELVEKQNTAVAILMASIVIGVALIVSSAIHG